MDDVFNQVKEVFKRVPISTKSIVEDSECGQII